MRINMAGGYTTYEFLDAIDCIVQCLRLNGVDEIRAITLYLHLYHEGRRVEFEDQATGAPFNILKHEGRVRRPYKIVSPRLMPDGSEDRSGAKGGQTT